MSKESERLPVHIDPFRLAQAGREHDGSLLLAHFKRLAPLLTQTEGFVQVNLRFAVETVGVKLSILQGQIKTDLQIHCQRCFEPMPFNVNAEFSLAFVKTASQAEMVPGQYEPYLVEQLPVTLLDLLEDEILLYLPSIPRHDLQDCPASHWINEATQDQDSQENELTHGRQNTDADNPFSVLARLKTPDKGK